MSKTIRWDDPSYNTRPSKSVESNSSSNETLPIANAVGNIPAQPAKSQSIPTSTSWRELTSRDGRTYYFNAVTQKTVWEMPQEYREYLEFSRGDHSSAKRATSAADDAFWAVLKERNVTSKFSWEEALRAVITHPNYKCIPSLQERKASFARFCEAMRAVEAEEEKRQLAAMKDAFKAALLADTRVDSRSTWRQIADWYGETEVFKAIDSSRDRLEVFDAVIAELKDQEASGCVPRRSSTFSLFSQVLQEMDVRLDPERGTLPDWRQVKPLLTEKASSVPELAQLDPAELFKAFHDCMEAQFNEYERVRKLSREESLKKEFILREEFYFLLRKLAWEGKLTPFSTWASIFTAHLKESSEYEQLVGIYLYGSTPLDCFYDVLLEVQQAYKQDRAMIADFLKTKFGTSARDMLPTKLRKLPRFQEELASLKPQLQSIRSIDYAFEELFATLQQVEPSREQIDAYKHFLKHCRPPITLRDRWSSVKERLRGHPEYEALTEDLRESYFYKYLKWLDGREGKRSRSPVGHYSHRK